MIKYINIQDSRRTKIETIEEIDSADYDNSREFWKAVNFIFRETALAYKNTGFTPYLSQRCTKEWKER